MFGNRKYLFASKTIIANLLLGLASFIPAAREIIVTHPQEALVAISVLNGVLRLVTKDQINLYREPPRANDDAWMLAEKNPLPPVVE